MDTTTERRAHGGPLHTVPSKVELARHVGEDHEIGGHIHRVVTPTANVRARWTRQELEQTHAAMHEGVTR